MRKLLILLLAFLSSCSYKDYIVLNHKYIKGKYNDDKTKFAFFRLTTVKKPPKGIATFPDGGISKTLYSDLSVYIYDVSKQKLTKVHSFSKYYKSNWLDFDHDGYLYFSNFIYLHFESDTPQKFSDKEHINNTGIFSYDIKNSKLRKFQSNIEKPQMSNDKKSIAYGLYTPENIKIHVMDKIGENIKMIDVGEQPIFSPDDKYIVYYQELPNQMFKLKLYALEANQTSTIATIKSLNHYLIFWIDNFKLYFRKNSYKYYDIRDKSIHDTVFIKYPLSDKEISQKKIIAFTKNINYTDWGFSLLECCPKSKEEIIQAIIKSDKGNFEYRNALLHEIGASLSENDINEFLKLFEKELSSIEEKDKYLYERNTKPMLEYLNYLKAR